MTGAPVLIVEDEPLIAMLVEDWLAQLGYAPIGPSSRVDEALKLIRTRDLAAAIIDVSLGKEDCYPVADLLADMQVPFAFATGRAEEAIPPRHAGTPLLRKPYDLNELDAVMKKLLAARKN